MDSTVMTIEEFLKAEGEKDLLRFSTAGSVDDGKSTLIGRLLCDSKNIYLDQLASVKRVSGQINHDLEIDYAFFTDGLKAEREQGITIDVAYRFFSTPRRKFIIADTPGHEQYTRNMATGASTANLALILIDARKGVLPQSKRHAFISSLLGIPHVVVAVNKMDLVDYREPVFQEIVRDFTSFAARLQIPDLRFIPVSALVGDNLLVKSERTPWYRGQPLMEILETITVTGDRNLVDLRFPVQMVIRPDLDYRAYAGVVASGVMRPGDEVVVLPSQKTSRIRSIETWEGSLQEAFPPLSVAVTLEDELDVGRGDMLVHRHNLPRTGRHIEAMVVWMGEQPLDPARRYLIKQTTRMTDTAVDRILYRVDINTLKREPAGQLALNEIGRVVFATARPLFTDPYQRNHATGSFVLIDPLTYATVGAGMVIDREPVVEPAGSEGKPPAGDFQFRRSRIPAEARRRRLGQRAVTLFLTGLPGAGKTDIAYALEERIFSAGGTVLVLDGENMRLGLSRDLDFSPESLLEHFRRVGETARLLNEAGITVICAFTSPLAAHRAVCAESVGAGRFHELYVDSPLAWCREYGVPELYAKADRGELPHFPGVGTVYEAPEKPALVLPNHEIGPDSVVKRILTWLEEQGIFPLRD